MPPDADDAGGAVAAETPGRQAAGRLRPVPVPAPPAPALKPPPETAPSPAPVAAARLTPAAERRGRLREMRRVWWVCGVGYWVQGFRCFRGWPSTSTSPAASASAPPRCSSRRTRHSPSPSALFGASPTATSDARTASLHLQLEEPKIMFTAFSVLLGFQLALSLGTKETLPSTQETLASTPRNTRSPSGQKLIGSQSCKQFSNLMMAVSRGQDILPSHMDHDIICCCAYSVWNDVLLSDSVSEACPSIIGLSKVMDKSCVLSLTVLYNRYLKRIHLRHPYRWNSNAICCSSSSQILPLLKQINLMLGIPTRSMCFVSQLLLRQLLSSSSSILCLLSSLCPPGCEGSLFAFFTSGLVFSAILSGVFGVGLSTSNRVSSVDYSNLPLGICCRVCCTASTGMDILVPEKWTADEKIVIQMI
ncbi:hypothetical protein HU200_039408 [Digitaria exilis]|uniref:Uncharacterized protein n=1 Tax=Digitaria exilis TaxID=1010633 RepID=A0A835B8L5_9POAL|nr:hypothetical protein HU200_039408 [Digitaria exilis]